LSETETVVVTTEDRTVPAIAYGLYLLGLVNGVTILIGLIVAYMNRDNAGPRMRTHYTFLIRTFWIGLGVFVALGALIFISAILSILLIGIPFLMLFLFLWGVVGVWFAVRCIVGLVYLSQGEAYPRPNSWLI
jgi:Predicted membrane protein